jgi:hypothetical protein
VGRHDRMRHSGWSSGAVDGASLAADHPRTRSRSGPVPSRPAGRAGRAPPSRLMPARRGAGAPRPGDRRPMPRGRWSTVTRRRAAAAPPGATRSSPRRRARPAVPAARAATAARRGLAGARWGSPGTSLRELGRGLRPFIVMRRCNGARPATSGSRGSLRRLAAPRAQCALLV